MGRLDRLERQVKCGVRGHKFHYVSESLMWETVSFKCELCELTYSRPHDKLTPSEQAAVDAVFTPGEEPRE